MPERMHGSHRARPGTPIKTAEVGGGPLAGRKLSAVQRTTNRGYSRLSLALSSPTMLQPTDMLRRRSGLALLSVSNFGAF